MSKSTVAVAILMGYYHESRSVHDYHLHGPTIPSLPQFTIEYEKDVKGSSNMTCTHVLSELRYGRIRGCLEELRCRLNKIINAFLVFINIRIDDLLVSELQ